MQNLILHAWQPITNLKKHYVSDARVELNDEGLFIILGEKTPSSGEARVEMNRLRQR
ncbi:MULTISPECIES: hypothetical protein [Allobacillus]|uniref:hypothetical protein n=1 Tax=Allobacillus TaxID=1400133 RepID=UPI001642B1AC|nr:hypothetical protein [Allobacillus salarius]